MPDIRDCIGDIAKVALRSRGFHRLSEVKSIVTQNKECNDQNDDCFHNSLLRVEHKRIKVNGLCILQNYYSTAFITKMKVD